MLRYHVKVCCSPTVLLENQFFGVNVDTNSLILNGVSIPASFIRNDQISQIQLITPVVNTRQRKTQLESMHKHILPARSEKIMQVTT